MRIGRCLEVDRDAIGQTRGFLDLSALGTGQKLDVDIPAKALAPSNDVQRGQHPVGGPRRAPRDTGGEEEALREPLALRLYECGRRLIGGEGRALDLAPAERRAVAARK